MLGPEGYPEVTWPGLSRGGEAKRGPLVAPPQVAELSLIHSEALRTTDMLEREIDALRDAVRGSPARSSPSRP